MSSEDQATSETSETLSSDEQLDSQESGESQTDWRAENTRLRQQLKKVQDLNREAAPYVQLAVALHQAEGGSEIIQRLQEGKPLTAAQQKQVEKAQESTGGDKADTQGLVNELRTAYREELAQFKEQTRMEREAEKHIQKLHTKAKEEFPGYDSLIETPQWSNMLSNTLEHIKAGSMEVPDDEPDPYYFAIKATWATLKALNPKLGEKKPEKKTEQERRAAINRSQTPATKLTPEEEDKLPEYARLTGRASAVTGGRSFSSLSRKN